MSLAWPGSPRLLAGPVAAPPIGPMTPPDLCTAKLVWPAATLRGSDRLHHPSRDHQPAGPAIQDPEFGPQHFPALIRYFDGIDAALSRRMLRPTPPHEPAQTNEFCALMDARVQRSEGKPDFTCDDLNAALAACGDGLSFDVTIETHPHSAAMEAYVSQSDLGLVIEYRNHILPEHDWSTAYLVQAKRAFRASGRTSYDEASRFDSVNTAQQKALEALAGVLGPLAVRYGLYCPPTPSLPEPALTKVRALHTANLADEIFDFAAGQALKDWLVQNQGRVDAGMWLTPVTPKPTGLMALHKAAFHEALPLTWFILRHFNARGPFRRHDLRHHLEDAEPAVDRDLVGGLVRGDPSAVKAVLDALGESREAAPPRPLPAHTVTISVSQGAGLPEGRARLDAD